MRILILTQNYYPEPDQKMHILAKELLRIGHDVKVITGFPNYPQGKIYPSYRQRIVQKEVIEGISLIRLPLYPDKSKSVMKRSLNYLSFPFSAALLGPLLCGPADVMLVYHPPVTLGIPAWVISAIRRVPFIYEIQDMWPETLTATGMMSNAFLLKTLEILGNLTYRRASAITVISPGFKRNLVFKGIDSGKIRVFYNWAYEGEISPAEKDMDYAERYGLVDRFNIIYAGNLGPAQGLNNVVDAAVLLTDIKNLQFVLVGGGINLEEVKKQVKVRNLRNVMLLPRVPIERMPGIYALADALMIHLSDDPLF